MRTASSHKITRQQLDNWRRSKGLSFFHHSCAAKEIGFEFENLCRVGTIKQSIEVWSGRWESNPDTITAMLPTLWAILANCRPKPAIIG